MSTQGWAKAPDPRCGPPAEHQDAGQREVYAPPSSTWQVWQQVIIGEILNVLERRRYDRTALR